VNSGPFKSQDIAVLNRFLEIKKQYRYSYELCFIRASVSMCVM